jgi:hypothetical protein
MQLTNRTDSSEMSKQLDRYSTLHDAAQRVGESLPRGVRTVRGNSRAKFTDPSGLQRGLDDIREFPDVKGEISPMHKSPIKSSLACEKVFFFRWANCFRYRATNFYKTCLGLNFSGSSDLLLAAGTTNR